MTEKLKKGFALMTAERHRQIASIGGRTAHREGKAYKFTPEKAREAGRKGGLARKAKKAATTQEQQS